MDEPITNKNLKKFLLNRFEEFESQWFDDEKSAKLDKVFKLGDPSKSKTRADTEMTIHHIFQDHQLKVFQDNEYFPPRRTCKACKTIGYEDHALAVLDRKDLEKKPLGSDTIAKAAKIFEFFNAAALPHLCPKDSGEKQLEQIEECLKWMEKWIESQAPDNKSYREVIDALTCGDHSFTEDFLNFLRMVASNFIFLYDSLDNYDDDPFSSDLLDYWKKVQIFDCYEFEKR